MDQIDQFMREILTQAGFPDDQAMEELVPMMTDTFFDWLEIRIQQKLGNKNDIQAFRTLSEHDRPYQWLTQKISDFPNWFQDRAMEFAKDYIHKMKQAEIDR